MKKITALWIITVLVLFLVAVTFGIVMRLNQGNSIQLSPVGFYSTMTAHGLTMIGIWVVAGLAALHYLLQRYVSISPKLGYFAFGMTVVGVLLLFLVIFAGKFHTGWTFLYPLPFYAVGEKWASPGFLVAIGLLGIGWTVWVAGMLLAIFKKYPLPVAFAWQHLRKSPAVETPPLVLISTISLVGVLLSLATAVVVLVFYFIEYFSGRAVTNDALLMKNLTFFFGHTLFNEVLYLGLASLYELFPEVSGRPRFRTTWYVALAWNCTLCFILTAFFHHMYMDFAQPLVFQAIGQYASYFASLPAASITAFSVLALVVRSPIKWSLTNALFFTGVMGWLIGGIGAVIDATIANNFILHNTLWVAAHFHTYNVLGNVLFSLAFFHWAANEFSGKQTNERSDDLKIFLLLIGGLGFVLMFYLGGAYSVPRRFNVYPELFSDAGWMALVGAFFATIYLAALVLFSYSIIKKCVPSLRR
ncbi:MAG: cytochrome c oxidase subunit 1 [Saprospiraceae bacterium]|jgi:cytochrome c oxidase subunit 1|nr:cytochrome c oxidase subunit 1 [Saprospiraceae bacterium]